jgi:hypothetical protein
MPEQGEKPIVDVDSVSISDSVSQIVEVLYFFFIWLVHDDLD